MGVNFEVYKGEFEIGKKYNFQIPLTRTIINKDGRIILVVLRTLYYVYNKKSNNIRRFSPIWYYDQINPDAYRAKVNVLLIKQVQNYFVAEFKD